MKQCVFRNYVCTSCGVKTDREDAVRACPFIVKVHQESGPPGLGDRVASALAAVGITKERAAAVIGDCGCKQRQQWLNMFGRRFGIGGQTGDDDSSLDPRPASTAENTQS